MEKFDLIIVGGGVSGMFAACSEFNHYKTLVIDKNKAILKKFIMTGKGKSNITNTSDTKVFIDNLIDANKFIYPALNKYNSHGIIQLLDNLNIKYHEKTPHRIHLIDANEVFRDKLINYISSHKNVQYRLNDEVIQIIKSNNQYYVKTKTSEFMTEHLIIATGGMSFPKTGSNGFGYKIAKQFGHNICDLYPIGVGFYVNNLDYAILNGQSLDNVCAKVYWDNKLKYSEVGPLMFTLNGIGGPVIRRVSGYATKYLQNHEACKVEISLIDESQVMQELNSKKWLKDCFKELSHKVIDYFIGDYYKQYNDLNNMPKQIKKEICDRLSHWTIDVSKTDEIELAINTGGGVDLKQINPNTYESNLVPGLYFIGEVLDVNPRTNGFNITVCYATANKCMEHISSKFNK